MYLDLAPNYWTEGAAIGFRGAGTAGRCPGQACRPRRIPADYAGSLGCSPSTPRPMRLADTTVLVTGGSSGIGAATAHAMARRGAQLILVARDPDRLRTVAEELRARGTVAHVYPTDLADPQAVQGLAERILIQHGPPDVLVNNAGAGRWLTVEETSAEELRRITDLPYMAAFNLTRGLLPAMRRRGTGHIVNVTSVASRLVWPGAAAYTAARWAMLAFSESLSAELSGTGLGVTVAVFGTVASPYWDHNPGSEARLPLADRSIPRLTPDAAAEALVQGVEAGAHEVIRPRRFRLLFLLKALAPVTTARMLRRGRKGA
jgi:uncharacterized protein